MLFLLIFQAFARYYTALQVLYPSIASTGEPNILSFETGTQNPLMIKAYLYAIKKAARSA